MSKPKLKQELTAPTRETVDALPSLIVLMDETGAAESWPDMPYAEVLQARIERRPEDKDDPLITDLPNTIGTRVVLGFIKPEASVFERLSQARKLAAAALAAPTARMHILMRSTEPAACAATSTLLAALLAASHRLPNYKQKQPSARVLEDVTLWGLTERIDLARVAAEAAANDLARDLTVRPPNMLTPRLYREETERLAELYGWEVTFFDEAALRQEQAGAFLAVAQGSADRDAGIVRLRYRPRDHKKEDAPVALVGKGICFDTGGTNLKPAGGMLGMHGDMQGSAVALGTLLALSELHAPFPVDCWLALAQNHIGPKAYKQNDVVTACNGTSIEVVHTDAEGRMVLADTLALASRDAPRLILDYATLTGACVVALGTRYSGAFTNRDAWIGDIIAAGRDSGERVWPFPTDADYDEALDSTVADIKQCVIEGEADHILAARFLNRFVPSAIPWIHVDLAAGEHKGGLAHVPTDVTGFGIRFTLSLLLDRKLPN